MENKDYRFKPFDKVLVRDRKDEKWKIDFFSHYNHDSGDCDLFPYMTIQSRYIMCVPYEGNEHLFQTSDSSNKKWEMVVGEIVAARTNLNTPWKIAIIVEIINDNYMVEFTPGSRVRSYECAPLSVVFDLDSINKEEE